MACDEIAEPNEHFGNNVHVGRWTIAIALQETPDPCLPHHVTCKIEVEGGQCMSRIAQHLHCRSASPEHHEWTKRRIDRHAENELVGARASDHRLYCEPFDSRI